jgi:urease accessory protein
MQRAFAVHHRGSWPTDDAVDAVTLTYLDRNRRRIRLVADSGASFLLDLPRAHHLGDGDGLELDTGGYIRVRAAREPVLEIATEDRPSLLSIAWHLGNRHLPMQVAGERLRIRADHVIADMVVGLGGRLIELDAPFDPESGAYGATPHDHDHHE